LEALGDGAGHAGEGEELFEGGFADALDGAELAQQSAAAGGADAGDASAVRSRVSILSLFLAW